MLPTPAQVTAPLIPMLCRAVIEAVADRAGETPTDRESRGQAALRSIEAFEPRDAVETMIAGQAVMFECLIEDAIHDSHHAETSESAQRHRRQALSMGRMQLAWFKEFRLHRANRYPEVAQTPEPAVTVVGETRPDAAPVPPARPVAATVPAQDQVIEGTARAPVMVRVMPPEVAPPSDATRIGTQLPVSEPRSQLSSTAAVVATTPAEARPSAGT